MKKTLSLKRETLTELTAAELSAVAGGTGVTVTCTSIDKVTAKVCHSYKCTEA